MMDSKLEPLILHQQIETAKKNPRVSYSTLQILLNTQETGTSPKSPLNARGAQSNRRINWGDLVKDSELWNLK